MRKILYTHQRFSDSPQQLMMTWINLKNESVEEVQKEVDYVFKDNTAVKNAIFTNTQSAKPPGLGDTIWTRTSNKHVGYAIVQETPDSPIHLEALKMCCRGLERKALEMGQRAVALPLIAPDNDLETWNNIYPTIEESFDEVDIIVCIPEKDILFQVLKSIGGEIQEHTVTFYNGPIDVPFIRFR